MEVSQVQTAGHWLAETKVAGETNALCTLATNQMVLLLQSQRIKTRRT
ncbi:MAG: hypothetical protein IPM85_11500 [Chitinophagaceae bacterium]|nr:hypothetical protein [Chitinophagaceae bacterium]